MYTRKHAHREHSFTMSWYIQNQRCQMFLSTIACYHQSHLWFGGNTTIRDFLQPTYLDRKSEHNICVTGFIQASSVVGLSRLQAWLDAIWTPGPVLSKLCSNPQYSKEFMEPTDDAAFVYFLVHLGVRSTKITCRIRYYPILSYYNLTYE
jgi:hypothetical protein